MISTQIIKKTIDELHAITKVELFVYDAEGDLVASTVQEEETLPADVAQFVQSPADSQEVRGYHYFKVFNEEETEYVLISRGSGEDVHIMGKVAVCQLQNLSEAYKERFDRNSFIQNLLLDNLLLVDVYNRAKKLRISEEAYRIVYVIGMSTEKDDTSMEILRNLFNENADDFITAVDEKSIIYVKQLESGDDYESVRETANLISDMLSTEAMSNARVAYGTIVPDIQQVSRSYKEARMALSVGKIFYPQQRIHAYNALGIGRLIYQLPESLCEMFISEVFTDMKPDDFDEETLLTINKFFENNLNVSETARQMFVHRNTLVYRLEKLQKASGLDIRNFEDALTFRIALMVTNYMHYMESEKNIR